MGFTVPQWADLGVTAASDLLKFTQYFWLRVNDIAVFSQKETLFPIKSDLDILDLDMLDYNFGHF